jgi:2'-5' RNA ligase
VIRLFVAIALPPEVSEHLAPLCEGVPGAAWHAAEKLHLTLRFLGDTDEAKAEDLDLALSGLTSPAFDLTLAGVGAFETRGLPSSLWVGAETSPPLAGLHRRCGQATRRAGFPGDPRAWRPHVTLAYLFRADPGRVGAWILRHNLTRLGPIPVRSFGLYSSWPGRAGRAYRLERTYPLQTAA